MKNRQGQSFFLNVGNSLSGQSWIERLSDIDRKAALAISQRLDLPELVGRVLAARGVGLEDASSFLAPTLRELMPDPTTLTDMNVATERLVKAVQTSEKVAIFGDYDVDGACSSALLYKFLHHHGLTPKIHIPDRIFEGYGPNIPAIEQLVEDGATLIVTVDCGATSFEALERAKQLGVDVVVLDHHQMGTEIPVSVALVNPNRQDDLSGLGHLCAAGVVFMAMVSVTRALREQGSYSGERKPPDMMQWLDLVALATVCDVVPLKGLNRAFVVTGLQVMSKQQNVGLKALMRAGRLDGAPKPYHLGFVLGPRINAGGRIGDAALGSRLLTTGDEGTATDIATQLNVLNEERQRAEAVMLEEAISEAEREHRDGDGPAIVITASQEWHPGIVGLLASRLKERFRRPAFAVAFDRNGKGSGSGRSISGVDLGASVRAAVEEGLLVKGGGHAMAAGLTVEKEKLGQFRGFMEERLAQTVAELSSKQQLKIDGALTARSTTIDLIDLLERAGPYGQGHPQPVFAFPAHQIRYPKIVGKDHVSFTANASDGAQLRAIAFRAAETPLGDALLNGQGQSLHLVGTLNADFWQGTRRVQLRLLDAAKAQV
ncbi:MAG: single-stranded-DNA-specific exonuclease RecJ [Rhizobiaceae bacterium]|nr:single-stranded-DNA-specific exonuclease RecJ [Rhizobiaceae bacterium]